MFTCQYLDIVKNFKIPEAYFQMVVIEIININNFGNVKVISSALGLFILKNNLDINIHSIIMKTKIKKEKWSPM